MGKYRKFTPEYRDEAVNIVIETSRRLLKWPAISVSMRALWGTG